MQRLGYQHQRVVRGDGIERLAVRDFQVGRQDGVEPTGINPLPLGHLGHFAAQGVPHLGVGFVLETREVVRAVEYGGNAGVFVSSDKARQQGLPLQVDDLGVAVFLRQHFLLCACSGNDAIPHGQCLHDVVMAIDRQNGPATEDDIGCGPAAASEQQGQRGQSKPGRGVLRLLHVLCVLLVHGCDGGVIRVPMPVMRQACAGLRGCSGASTAAPTGCLRGRRH